jgi:hypothetical protein
MEKWFLAIICQKELMNGTEPRHDGWTHARNSNLGLAGYETTAQL